MTQSYKQTWLLAVGFGRFEHLDLKRANGKTRNEKFVLQNLGLQQATELKLEAMIQTTNP